MNIICVTQISWDMSPCDPRMNATTIILIKINVPGSKSGIIKVAEGYFFI